MAHFDKLMTKIMRLFIECERSNFQNAPIELKFINNGPYDILSILKIFLNWFKIIKGSFGVVMHIQRLTYPMPLERAQHLVFLGGDNFGSNLSILNRNVPMCIDMGKHFKLAIMHFWYQIQFLHKISH